MNNKQRLFEIMGMINPDFASTDSNDWAIFKIQHGMKLFLIQLDGIDNLRFHAFEGLRYSDPKVLKFNSEEAKNLIIQNKSFGETYGIVNSKGVQLGLGEYDKVWGKV